MPRQRNVYPTDEIPHLWAHQTQSSARNAQNNLYFEGDSIYSYGSHFTIARFITSPVGLGRAVLLNTDKYSSTTAKHCHAVRQAIPEYLPVFHTNRPSSGIDAVWRDYVHRVGQLQTKFDTTKVARNKHTVLRDLDVLVEEANKFATFMAFRMRVKAERELTDEQSRKAIEQEGALAARQYEKHAKERLEREERQRIETIDLPGKIALWRSGGAVYLPYSLPCMLRVEGQELVTSQGARVPLTHAARLLKVVEQVKESGKEYVRNGHTERVGLYSVDRIEANGTLHAGCHVIQWEEIERVAPIVRQVRVEEMDIETEV